MDTRALSSNLAMDERSDLMYLLQEKNKRLERFKRSATQMAAESSYVNAVPSTMATIPEGLSKLYRLHYSYVSGFIRVAFYHALHEMQKA